MLKICLYFQVHQPLRIKKYRVFDIGLDNNYFDDASDTPLNNKKVLEKVANKCYLPANKIFLDLLKKHPELKLSFSFSGVFLEAAQNFYPEVLESFKKLVETDRVEVLSETYHHSLSSIYSPAEFRRQVQLHKKKIKEVFGVEPKVFRNTELIFNNDLAFEAEGLGFEGVLAEGADRILGWRSPNFLYKSIVAKNIKLLLKNYQLSDDIAFRFSSKEWKEYPLTSEKYAAWIHALDGQADIVNLFLDYETFGEHQWEDTGIFEFLKHLPGHLLKNPNVEFVTPHEAVRKLESVGTLDFADFVSWADIERDLSAWADNPMQIDALRKLYELESMIFELGDEKLVDDWRKLTTSDHFYYMCTKYFADGDVHKYFNPYETPYEAFITFMNVLTDLRLRAENKKLVSDIKLKQTKEEFGKYAQGHSVR